MKLIRLATLSSIVLVLCGFGFAQNMPFPQSKAINNSSGIKPTCVSQAEMNRKIKELYLGWKKNWIRKSLQSGQFYLYSTGTGGTDNQITISEAHGFGMVIFALMAGADDSAKIYFDGFNAFYKRFELSNHLMNWAIETGEKVSSASKGSATDGDIDIAYSLLLADKQWGGGSYKTDAVDLINGIMANEVNTGLNVTKLGYWPLGQPDPTQSRPSDWMPAEFRAFATAGGSASWNTMADQSSTYLKMFQSSVSTTTGLISDFVVGLTSSSIGQCGADFLGEYKYTDKFFYNACRVPMRIGLDYAQYGTTAAKEGLSKMITWLDATKTKNDPNKISNGYDVKGGTTLAAITDEYDPGESIGFTGPFMAACIVDAKFQKFLDKGYYCLTRNEMWVDSVSQEYEQSIALMSLLTLSGNWWKPGDANTKLLDPTVNTTNTVAFDGFNNGFGGSVIQNDLSAKLAIDKGEPADKYAAVWEADYLGVGGVYNQKGGTLVNKKDISSLITNGELHAYCLVKGKNASDEDIYAQLTCPLVGDSLVSNKLDNIDGITLRVKGSGMLRVELFTKDIIDLPADKRWGFYGFEFALSSGYTDVKIPLAYFTPSVYSPPEDSGWGFNNMANGKRIMQLNIAGVYPANIVTGSECEFWIDTMYLNGVKYSDITTLTTPIQTLQSGTKNNLFNLKAQMRNNRISLTYTLNKAAEVSISVCNLKGGTVASFRSDMQQAGNQQVHLTAAKPLASGLYLVKFTAGNNTTTLKYDCNR